VKLLIFRNGVEIEYIVKLKLGQNINIEQGKQSQQNIPDAYKFFFGKERSKNETTENQVTGGESS
jgi:hypothetical protein